MALGPQAWSALRLALSRLLSDARTSTSRLQKYLTPIAGAELFVPVRIGNFTDFFASVFHATNAGKMFRPDNPLMPNYKYVPVAYHSRASSVCVERHAGAPAARPIQGPGRGGAGLSGRAAISTTSWSSASTSARPTRSGEPVPIGKAGEHIFGFCLLNDWSARDIQAWEYAAARTVSRQELRHHGLALGGHRRGARAVPRAGVRATGRRSGAAALSRRRQTTARAAGSTSRSRSFWPPRKCDGGRPAAAAEHRLVRHHLLDGRADGRPSHQQRLQPGDRRPDRPPAPARARRTTAAAACWRSPRAAPQPITLPNGETRGFLEDGDEVIFRAHCGGDGRAARVGFGECRAVVLPARTS